MQRIDRRDGNRKMYVARVLVKKKNGHPRYVYGLGDKKHPAKRDFDATGTFSYDEQLKTFHIPATSRSKAFKRATKYGIVQSVRLGHSKKPIYGNIETVLRRKEYIGGNAIELEEFPDLYIQKEKERERHREKRDNLQQEKERDLLLDF